jgi:GTPase involved in cell partitioning and DNA repair
MEEMRLHSRDLPKKVMTVVFTKTDLVDQDALKELRKIAFPKKLKIHFVSAVTGSGIEDLLKRFWESLK